MRLVDLFTHWATRLTPIPQPPNRPMSTPEDVRWQRLQVEALKREAEMLGIDVDLERAAREHE